MDSDELANLTRAIAHEVHASLEKKNVALDVKFIVTLASINDEDEPISEVGSNIPMRAASMILRDIADQLETIVEAKEQKSKGAN